MMGEITTSTTLDLAADAIQMGGWQTGREGMAADGPYCALGAIGAVSGAEVEGGRYNYRDCYSAAGWALSAYLADPNRADEPRDVYFWNDRPERTAEEVIEVLRAAAAVERVKEATEARLLGEPVQYDTEDQPLPIEVAA